MIVAEHGVEILAGEGTQGLVAVEGGNSDSSQQEGADRNDGPDAEPWDSA